MRRAFESAGNYHTIALASAEALGVLRAANDKVRLANMTCEQTARG
jgi:hypothetical protein